MTADTKNIWVEKGQAFAGGVLTEKGASEVNGHRARVLQKGGKTVTAKVLRVYYSRFGITEEQRKKAREALDTTPW
jgi:hypothetical protein